MFLRKSLQTFCRVFFRKIRRRFFQKLLREFYSMFLCKFLQKKILEILLDVQEDILPAVGSSRCSFRNSSISFFGPSIVNFPGENLYESWFRSFSEVSYSFRKSSWRSPKILAHWTFQKFFLNHSRWSTEDFSRSSTGHSSRSPFRNYCGISFTKFSSSFFLNFYWFFFSGNSFKSSRVNSPGKCFGDSSSSKILREGLPYSSFFDYSFRNACGNSSRSPHGNCFWSGYENSAGKY